MIFLYIWIVSQIYSNVSFSLNLFIACLDKALSSGKLYPSVNSNYCILNRDTKLLEHSPCSILKGQQNFLLPLLLLFPITCNLMASLCSPQDPTLLLINTSVALWGMCTQNHRLILVALDHAMEWAISCPQGQGQREHPPAVKCTKHQCYAIHSSQN